MGFKKYLIIGVHGFIGQHLAEYLRSVGCDVFGADIKSNGIERSFFLINPDNPDFFKIFAENTFDFCINCSGAASVPNSLVDPYLDFELNVINVFKICDALRVHNPSCSFINLSSAAVYGNPISLPISEIDSIHPISPYGIHKNMSEEICREFHHNFNLKTCSLRVFSAFGEGLKKQFFWDLFNQMSEDKDIELFGTGNETRDFIYISDLVRAIYLVSQKSNFNADIVNIGNGVEVKIKDAALMFKDVFKFKNEINFSGAVRIGDPINWCADVSKLISFGYKSVFNLHKGLENYITWARTLKK